MGDLKILIHKTKTIKLFVKKIQKNIFTGFE